jgi:ABC-type Zn2+ transport system substrate-binding protein/surface adhesin
MEEYPDILMWVVIVVAFIGGYLIVSFLASRMKTAQPFTRDDRDTNESPKTKADRGSGQGYQREHESSKGDHERSEQREEKWETFSEERKYALILGLGERITPSDVKTAYRDLLAKYHPDKVNHLGEEFKQIAEKKTKEIVQAYQYFQRRYGIT